MKYFVGILLMGLVICLFYIGKQQTINKQLVDDLKSLDLKNLNLSSEQKMREKEIGMNGKRLSEDFVVFDKSGEYKWTDVVKEDKLVLLFSELYCDICIEAELENLKKMANAGGEQDIILLINSISTRYVSLLVKKYDLNFKIYQYSKELYKEIPDLMTPYYFVLQTNPMRMQSFFIPQKEEPELTQKYLRTVFSEYFKE